MTKAYTFEIDLDTMSITKVKRMRKDRRLGVGVWRQVGGMPDLEYDRDVPEGYMFGDSFDDFLREEGLMDEIMDEMDYYEECTCDEIEWDDGGMCPYCSEMEDEEE